MNDRETGVGTIASSLKQVVLASNNAGKLREFAALFETVGIELIPQGRLNVPEAEEPHPTFVENALTKARHAATLTGLPALADDSGLCVVALRGAPGVYSARYGGPTDRDRYMKLLGELEGIPDERRTARFVCIAAAVDPHKNTVETGEGIVRGRIAQQPGDPSGGFGYDAVFIPEGWEIVFSELPAGEKHAISHRGRAARALAD